MGAIPFNGDTVFEFPLGEIGVAFNVAEDDGAVEAVFVGVEAHEGVEEGFVAETAFKDKVGELALADELTGAVVAAAFLDVLDVDLGA